MLLSAVGMPRALRWFMRVSTGVSGGKGADPLVPLRHDARRRVPWHPKGGVIARARRLCSVRRRRQPLRLERKRHANLRNKPM
jgi:hypothetical protein